MATPSTDGIRGAVLIGFTYMAEQIMGPVGRALVNQDEVMADFEAWLDIERAKAFQVGLEAVQNQINQNVPITADSVLTVENPYVK